MTPPAVPQGRPWTVFHSPGEMYFEVQDDDGLEVVTLYYGGFVTDATALQERAKAAATANLIMTSVNAFGPLVEALANTDCYFCGRLIGEPAGLSCPRCENARAALSLARGGQP